MVSLWEGEEVPKRRTNLALQSRTKSERDQRRSQAVCVGNGTTIMPELVKLLVILGRAQYIYLEEIYRQTARKEYEIKKQGA